jgi:uncharacterized membrane protein YdjX (TVP38/TMEM64 family)
MRSNTAEQAPSIEKQSIKKNNFWLTFARILALAVVIALTVSIYIVRDRAEDFAKFGYPGIFLITFMAYATILIPAPGLAVVFAMGGVLNPFYVGLAAGAGGALGELSGYLAGFGGQVITERTNLYNRFHGWIEKNGFWAILILAALPNPFFDVAGVAAGILKMPIRKFLLAVWIGVTLKMLFFAWTGSSSISWILDKFKP